jgi:hypothetical protein
MERTYPKNWGLCPAYKSQGHLAAGRVTAMGTRGIIVVSTSSSMVKRIDLPASAIPLPSNQSGRGFVSTRVDA